MTGQVLPAVWVYARLPFISIFKTHLADSSYKWRIFAGYSIYFEDELQ